MIITYKLYPEDTDKSMIEQELNCSITWIDLVYSTVDDAYSVIDSRNEKCVAVKYKNRIYAQKFSESIERTIHSREVFAEKLRTEGKFSETSLAPMIAKTERLKERLRKQKAEEARNGEVVGVNWLIKIEKDEEE